MRNLIKLLLLVVVGFALLPTVTMAGSRKLSVKNFRYVPVIDPVTIGIWYRPVAAATWQWQLTGEINSNYDVDVYDIDLFDNSAETISSLKLSGKKVFCYFSAGSGEKWRSDFGKFNKASLGKPLEGWAGEKWLDIRSKNVLDVMLSRLDLAVLKGCDGVEPDNVDGYSNKTGFSITAADQLVFNRRIANEAHNRGLTVALKNDGDQAKELVDYFDLSINEECHRYRECDQLAVFTKQNKPIFNAEYKYKSSICPAAIASNIRTLFLPLELDDSSRVSCD